jgi:hypothetical protein
LKDEIFGFSQIFLGVEKVFVLRKKSVAVGYLAEDGGQV